MCSLIHPRDCASIVVYSRNLGYAVRLFRLIPLHRVVNVTLEKHRSILGMIYSVHASVLALDWICYSALDFLYVGTRTYVRLLGLNGAYHLLSVYRFSPEDPSRPQAS